MPDDESLAHKYFAAHCFNSCWDYIELAERTPEQDEEMVRLSEVSYWHWENYPDRTDRNLSVGLWQLARVHALAGDYDRAIAYANRCIEKAEQAELAPFFAAYGYEALARAECLAGKEYRESLDAAYRLVEKVEEADEKSSLLEDLKWIGPA